MLDSHFVTHFSLILVMVIGYLLGIVSITSSTTSVFVDSQGGTDKPDCLTGNGSCRCITYVLGSVQESMSLIINILPSPEWSRTCKYNNLEFDLLQSNITFTDYPSNGDKVFVHEKILLKNAKSITFENILFLISPLSQRFVYKIRYFNCAFYFNTNDLVPSFEVTELKFDDINTLLFSQCLFFPSSSFKQRTFVLHSTPYFTLNGIQNVYFADCLFKRPTAVAQYFSPLLFQFKKCKNVAYDGCSFLSNTEGIIRSTSAGNMERLLIKNCTFKQNKVSSMSSLILVSMIDQLEITNTIFTFNQLILSNQIAIIMIDSASLVTISNVTFLSNDGLGMNIYNASIYFLDVHFINNTGVNTGGVFLSLNEKTEFTATNFTNVSFESNKYTADYGGGMFIECFGYFNYFSHSHHSLNNTSFKDEEQGVSSNYDYCLANYFPTLSKKHWRLQACSININKSIIIPTLFPGKRISIPPLVVTDKVGNPAKCTSQLSVVNHTSNSDCEIEVRQQSTEAGTVPLLLKTSHLVPQLTYFYFLSTSSCLITVPTDIVARLHCENASTFINFNLRKCPLGYTFKITISSKGICQPESENLIYDEVTGIVCIQSNNWYGQVSAGGDNEVTTAVISSCTDPYCASGKACPIAGYTDTHQTLPWTQDEQCNGLYGGVLCRSCKENCVFTFGANKCIPLSDCKEDWQPYLIISLALVGQISLALVLICSRSKTGSGVGYLYGPLFFFAVYKLLPISHSYLQTTSSLEITISIYKSILLLDLDILGKVPWCFFPSLNQTLNYAFRFLGPLITFTVLLVIVLIARINFCYRLKINRIIQSPIQPMCLLILLSFWSLSKTSIEIVKPVAIEENWRFAIQPEYQYLGSAYAIMLFCIAVSLLVFVYLPFIFLLLLSQSYRAKVNLFRIQPLLDAFQSSYKDKCRWYSGVYLVAWVILNINMPMYVFIIITAGVALLHCLVQPHKSMFLNAADSFLLMDTLILASLSDSSSTSSNVTTVLIYPLLIVPLFYVLFGGVWMVIGNAILKCMKVVYRGHHPFNSYSQELTVTAVSKEEVLIDSGDVDIHSKIDLEKKKSVHVVSMVEREPLIYYDD